MWTAIHIFVMLLHDADMTRSSESLSHLQEETTLTLSDDEVEAEIQASHVQTGNHSIAVSTHGASEGVSLLSPGSSKMFMSLMNSVWLSKSTVSTRIWQSNPSTVQAHPDVQNSSVSVSHLAVRAHPNASAGVIYQNPQVSSRKTLKFHYCNLENTRELQQIRQDIFDSTQRNGPIPIPDLPDAVDIFYGSNSGLYVASLVPGRLDLKVYSKEDAKRRINKEFAESLEITPVKAQAWQKLHEEMMTRADQSRDALVSSEDVSGLEKIGLLGCLARIRGGGKAPVGIVLLSVHPNGVMMYVPLTHDLNSEANVKNLGANIILAISEYNTRFAGFKEEDLPLIVTVQLPLLGELEFARTILQGILVGAVESIIGGMQDALPTVGLAPHAFQKDPATSFQEAVKEFTAQPYIFKVAGRIWRAEVQGTNKEAYGFWFKFEDVGMA